MKYTKDDWIEDAKDLLKEVRGWHSDPVSVDYNECEKDPCQWCEQAQKLIDHEAGKLPSSDS